MIDHLLNLINSYPYLILFVGSILDHSGVPMFSVVAAILYTHKKISLINTFSLIIFSYTLVDSILFFIGKKYLKDRLSDHRLIKTMDILILEKGLKAYSRSKNSFYFFSKLIPAFGKYSPIFSGVSDENFIKVISKYLVGNITYFLLFFFPSMYIGEKIQKNSKIIAILMFVVFVVIYKVGERRIKKTTFDEVNEVNVKKMK